MAELDKCSHNVCTNQENGKRFYICLFTKISKCYKCKEHYTIPMQNRAACILWDTAKKYKLHSNCLKYSIAISNILLLQLKNYLRCQNDDAA